MSYDDMVRHQELQEEFERRELQRDSRTLISSYTIYTDPHPTMQKIVKRIKPRYYDLTALYIRTKKDNFCVPYTDKSFLVDHKYAKTFELYPFLIHCMDAKHFGIRTVYNIKTEFERSLLEITEENVDEIVSRIAEVNYPPHMSYEYRQLLEPIFNRLLPNHKKISFGRLSPDPFIYHDIFNDMKTSSVTLGQYQS